MTSSGFHPASSTGTVATASTSVTHIAIQESLNRKTVEWMEKVSDDQYGQSQSISGRVMDNMKEPSPAQKLIGDLDPKHIPMKTSLAEM